MRLFLFLGCCCYAFGASDIPFAETDFIIRTINFVIFIIILWLLLAKKAKAFFNTRRENISQKLLDVQERLKNAKSNKEQVLRKLEEAKERANEIIANAKKESYMITQRIEEQSSIDIENMIKNVENLMQFEQKKMEREVVSEVLEEIFEESNIHADEYVKILEKKVA